MASDAVGRPRWGAGGTILVLILALVLFDTATDHRALVLGVKVTPRPILGLAANIPVDEPRGVTLRGLKKTTTGRCARALVGERSGHCFHGPDPAPEGVDVAKDRAPLPPSKTVAAELGSPTSQIYAGAGAGTVLCDGDGYSGNRVQVIYARPANRSDRYASYLSSFRIWAASADAAFDQSAARTGGSRHLRFVTDAACNPQIDNVVLSNSGANDIDATIVELQQRGYNRTDRIYMVWMDANVYCGIATLWDDSSPGGNNANNRGPSYARVDNACWGQSPSVEAHELMHMLGAVLPSAPHSTGSHCTDDNDRMCYNDGSGLPISIVCADSSYEWLFDCNNDDYFNTNPPSGSYLATHWNAANSSFLIAGQVSPPGLFTPLPPSRLLDTRDGTGGRQGPLAGGQVFDLQVTGRGGVPQSGVAAVALNVTVTEPSASTYVTVFPSGGARPFASNLNVVPGQTVPNLVVSGVGSAGRVALYVDSGSAHLVADVAGWYAAGGPGRFRALDPARILDTRNGTGGFTRMRPGQVIDVPVAGQGGVPSSGAGSVVLNATVVNPTSSGYLVLYPTGTSTPVASNLNFTPGTTVPNRVVAKLGSGGMVSIYNPLGFTEVILDVAGWYSDGSGSQNPAGALTALSPTRILDTRTGNGGFSTRILGGQTIQVQVGGRGGVPASGVTAVVMNATVTNTSGPGYLTVFPGGLGLPNASDLNFVGGQTVPNLVVVRLGSGGTVGTFSSAVTDVIFDVVGWIS